jgi:hypothetical protein
MFANGEWKIDFDENTKCKDKATISYTDDILMLGTLNINLLPKDLVEKLNDVFSDLNLYLKGQI